MSGRAILWVLVAVFGALLLSPSVASADHEPYGGGHGGVSASPPRSEGNGCYSSTITVEGDGDSVSVTIVVEGPEGVVDTQTKPVSDGQATFTVTVCEPGDYTVSATDQAGHDLGTAEFSVSPPSQGGGGGGTDGGATPVGGTPLPGTGASSSVAPLALIAGLALVAGCLMIMRRRSS